MLNKLSNRSSLTQNKKKVLDWKRMMKKVARYCLKSISRLKGLNNKSKLSVKSKGSSIRRDK